MAEKVGCHLSHINRIETGKYTPALETVVNIASALVIPVDYFINSTDGKAEEIRIEDQVLAEKVKLLNTLDEEERFIVNKLIDAILTKEKNVQPFERMSMKRWRLQLCLETVITV